MYSAFTLEAVVSMSAVLCSISPHRAGWLDRVVEFQKKRFIDDIMKQPTVKITARIERPPPGYVDSGDWDYESVLRLLVLIRDNEGAAPVRRAFRRAMKTRRFWGMAESFKMFPSLIKDHPNDFHYSVDSGEYYADVAYSDQTATTLESNDVIVVSNPVEAKLPSASISVNLLRTILENRAQAGRVMPTTKTAISWPAVTKRPTISAKNDKEIEVSTNASTAADEATLTTSEPSQTISTATDASTDLSAGDTTVTKDTETL